MESPIGSYCIIPSMRLKRTERTQNARGEILVPESQKNHGEGISIKIEYDMTGNPIYTINGGKIRGNDSVYTIDSLYRQGPFETIEDARVDAIENLTAIIQRETQFNNITVEYPDAPKRTQQRIQQI